MPVSHLALTVSHIPASTEFYLKALRPLGYNFIGHQGDSIGFGIEDADFFICQARDSTRISPTHVAFAADDRLTVRDCYTAALNAGGRPSGAPGDRSGGCGCFNAAVTDPDGNTIEFIHRQGRESLEDHASQPRSALSRSRAHYDSRSRVEDCESVSSSAFNTSRAQSRAKTALDIASAASGSMNSRVDSRGPGIRRSRTEPISMDGNKAFVGTLIGAAAGAVFAYAMVQSERDSARDEIDFARHTSGSRRSNGTRTSCDRSGTSRQSARSQSVANRGRDRLAIESASYSHDELPEVLSRHASSRRPLPRRSKTYDAIEYAPMSSTSARNSRHELKRATTLPVGIADEYDTMSRSTASKRGSVQDKKLQRHDSVVSVQSHMSRRSRDDGRRSSASTASTVKPSRREWRYDRPADVPLPASRTHSYVSAADMPLPSSRATSYYSATPMQSPRERARDSYAMDSGGESDGLGDMRSVVPEDSISCVDFSARPKADRRSTNSRHDSKRSEASTVRPAKASSRHSAQTLPFRSKDDRKVRDGKRSTCSHA